MEITGSIMIYIHWKLHTCCQNFITHRLHIKAKGMFNSNIHQKGTYFITQIGYISMHTRDAQQHKGTYFTPTANTSWITGSIHHVTQKTQVQYNMSHTIFQQHLLTSTLQLQPTRWPTPRMLHLDTHTQDKCNFPCLPYS